MTWTLEQLKALVKGVGIKKAMATIDGQEVVDADGNPVDVQAINLETGGGEAMADEPVEEQEAKASVTQDDIEKAVRKALDAQAKKAPRINGETHAARTVPAKARKCRVKNFVGPDAEWKAYAFGQTIAAAAGNTAGRKWLSDNGYLKTQTEGDDSAGGVLVPEELSNDLIRLIENYGVFRQNANIVPMSSETLRVPRVVSEGSASFIGEASSITAADDEYDSVLLVAKKLARLTRVSSELMQDAAMSMGDRLAQSFAQKFAQKEDEVGFTGTAISTDGGITGVTVKINDGNHAGGIYTAASGNTAFSTLDLADFHGVTGKVLSSAKPGAKWYVSSVGFALAMERLSAAQGGVTWAETSAGTGQSPRFLGWPVEITQVLNTTTGADTEAIKLLFGDLSQSSTLGDRASFTIATDNSRYFDTDEVAIRGIERLDIVNHDLGTAAVNTSPIVALKTPGS